MRRRDVRRRWIGRRLLLVERIYWEDGVEELVIVLTAYLFECGSLKYLWILKSPKRAIDKEVDK